MKSPYSLVYYITCISYTLTAQEYVGSQLIIANLSQAIYNCLMCECDAPPPLT